MTTRTTFNLSAMTALAVLLSASPVLAQGKGNGRGNDRGNDRGRTEEVRRDRDDDRRWEREDDRRRADGRVFSRRTTNRVPPGWCRGVGNPHRTAANCGYHTDRVYRGDDGRWRDRYGTVLRRDGVYRDRSGVLRDRNGNRIRTGTPVLGRNTSTSTTYRARHEAFQRELRARCEARARGRSLVDRLRIDRECAAEHAEWHRRTGTRH